MGTANDRETKGSLFFRFHQRCSRWGSGGLGLPFHAPEFLCVGKDKVHVLERRLGVSGISHRCKENMSKEMKERSKVEERSHLNG